MIKASCHCGAVQLEIPHQPESVTQCTCSICHRYGARWAYYTRDEVTVIAEPGATTAYIWGDRTAQFHHCNVCGCLTHYDGIEDASDSRRAVNSRMIDRATMSGVPVRTFDGADTWRYLDS